MRGTVRFTGKPLEMKVPKLRAGSDVCKRTKTPHNAVVVEDGKLKDVLVRIGAGSVAGVWKTPETRAEVRQSDCMYVPRIQGVMAGQGVVISNEDSTLHNQHVVRGYEVVAGRAQPKGAAPFELEVTEEPGIYRFSCDIHPWMRAFVVVTDHPFFAVSGEDGGFRIERVPAGRYEVEAWHSHYGRLEKRGVEVGAAGEVIVDFEYDEAMGEPEENKGELVGQW
ncbi:MAG: carboxypeptidase regulatory-like domain-containing protein [Polyangiaceae bacterium]